MKMSFVIAAALILFSFIKAEQTQAGRLVFSRPTIITIPCDGAPKWHVKVYEDVDYTFVYRHYERAEHLPGFFVQNKKLDRWVEIKKLSTENAKLGQSPSWEEVHISVGWDYSSLSKLDYVELPLKTSGSISFPDRILYDTRSQNYEFDFNSSLNREECLTRFWVSKQDIEEAFKRTH
jgi:hypothetical protein